MNIRHPLAAIAFGLIYVTGLCCTSAIIPPGVSKSGNVMLWKHRDTSHSNNYVDTVRGQSPEFDYIALFNASDSLKREAWAGVNRSGFAIINTVAGNLPKNRPCRADREGYVMSLALSKCKSVKDFETLLDTLPKPYGVRTDFGVIDSQGGMAYFETADNGYVKYVVPVNSTSPVIRTNYACSAPPKGGYGYERFANAEALLAEPAKVKLVTPELLTETLSRSYFSASECKDYSTTKTCTVKDNNFIPRPTSAASVVIELTETGPVMWSVVGYPPASVMLPATLDSVPKPLKRNPATGRSEQCDRANKLKHQMIGNGKIFMPAAKEISDSLRSVSLENYRAFREKMQFK
ncbi:MAG: hypothetical protein NC338_05550 [Firmicutes bacterium]|nr:hypothetical protein [Bacillota bacterium]MCM1401415.1 hypothetical protein [Bacteroides sp.]MCM1477315.1 hypothetical protein [Bacteroides sp.]